MFIDYAEVQVKAGNGGNGAVAFRREKFVPKGGPSGGNGGKGGDVIVEAHHNISTLLNFRYKKNFNAFNGEPGAGSLKDGKNGKDVVLQVPVGTIIRDAESKEIIVDLESDSDKVVLARGGKGGKGNSNFATSTRRTPRFAEDGKPGQSRKVIFELKVIADVGLVGFPNAGKSTLISTISAAKPKIADYPFTTLEPVLGIVQYKDYKSFTVADIPGIIEGAHEGKGLGHKFLKHIERTKIILYMIESTSENSQKDFDVLKNELKSYSKNLTRKKFLVGISKTDLLDEKEMKKIKKLKLKGYDDQPLLFSSVTNFNINDLLNKLWQNLEEEK